jgi:hypothetical protein
MRKARTGPDPGLLTLWYRGQAESRIGAPCRSPVFANPVPADAPRGNRESQDTFGERKFGGEVRARLAFCADSETLPCEPGLPHRPAGALSRRSLRTSLYKVPMSEVPKPEKPRPWGITKCWRCLHQQLSRRPFGLVYPGAPPFFLPLVLLLDLPLDPYSRFLRSSRLTSWRLSTPAVRTKRDLFSLRPLSFGSLPHPDAT